MAHTLCLGCVPNAVYIRFGQIAIENRHTTHATTSLAQVSEIAVTSNYGVADLRSELKDLYRKAGVKPALPLVFMLTDSQVGARSSSSPPSQK